MFADFLTLFVAVFKSMMKKLVKYMLGILIPKRYIIWNGNRRTSKNIALTFDDGPNPLYTEKFIDMLQIYGVKATFFLSGNEIERYPELVRKLVKHGHLIGNHTYLHRDISKIKTDEIKDELQRTQSIIEKVIGLKPTMFRPPHGRIGIKGILYCLKNKLRIIIWSLDSMDHHKKSVQSILEFVNVNTVKPGDIILFHDDNDYTLEFLPMLIENLKDEYEFVTIERMLMRRSLKGNKCLKERK